MKKLSVLVFVFICLVVFTSAGDLHAAKSKVAAEQAGTSGVKECCDMAKVSCGDAVNTSCCDTGKGKAGETCCKVVKGKDGEKCCVAVKCCDPKECKDSGKKKSKK